MDIFGSSYRCSPVRTARAFRLGAPHQSGRLGGTTALLRLLKSWCRSRRIRFAKPKRLPRRTRDGLQCTDLGKLSQIGLRSAHGCAMMRYSVRPTAVWKMIPAPKGEDLELETQVQIAVPPRTLLVGERAGALAAGPSSRPRRARTGLPARKERQTEHKKAARSLQARTLSLHGRWMDGCFCILSVCLYVRTYGVSK